MDTGFPLFDVCKVDLDMQMSSLNAAPCTALPGVNRSVRKTVCSSGLQSDPPGPISILKSRVEDTRGNQKVLIVGE